MQRETSPHPKGTIMLKTSLHRQPARFSEAAVLTSRQVWLASLGAAVVTRDWVQTEAGDVFKTLVKEGTVVESHAIRFVGDRIENSVSIANTVWKETRRTVESTVRQAADTAVSIAQQVLPKSLPKFELPLVATPRKPRAKPAKKAAKRTVKVVRKAKRAGKATTKRA
jgi:hypothetical protein